MGRALAIAGCLALLLGAFSDPAGAGPDEREKFERYPPSFRVAVEEAIQNGMTRLLGLQTEEGHFGNPAHPQALGHTALPVLALLKAGAAPDDEAIQRAFRAMQDMPLDKTYSVACYLMAIHAKYQPKLDTFDTDVGSMRAKRVKPKQIRAMLSEPDRAKVEAGLGFLVDAQNADGVWAYERPAAGSLAYDLSNTQYALLGLRAAADCGFRAKAKVWLDALTRLLAAQDAKGLEVELSRREVRDGYVIDHREKAEARPFRYKDGKKNGPLGENTVPNQPATGSMTAAGVACIAICAEGLWQSRKFKGGDRRRANAATRDGLAWLQTNFSVEENVGHPNKAHHHYYLYGLERMGMLTDTRFVGRHDWYKEGADLLLATQDDARGGWGGTVDTSFGILFLKRATRPTERVAISGD